MSQSSQQVGVDVKRSVIYPPESTTPNTQGVLIQSLHREIIFDGEYITITTYRDLEGERVFEWEINRDGLTFSGVGYTYQHAVWQLQGVLLDHNWM